MRILKVDDEADIEELSDDEKEAVRELAHRVVDEDEPLHDVLGLSGEFIGTMEYFAHKLYQKSRYEEAGVLIDAILALDDRRPYPYLLAGDVAMENEQWDDAVACLGAALDLGFQTSLVEGKLGESLLRVGRLEDAVYHLRQAIVLAEGDDAPYRRRSEVLLEVLDGNVESAEPVAA